MGLLEGFNKKTNSLTGNIKKKIESFAEIILDHIPENKRKAAGIWAGATVSSLILVTLISIAIQPKKPAVEVPATSLLAISSDELFYPEEPDFLPDYLFEREPRSSWDLDDIRPFWKNPGQGNLEIWREEMSSVIDRMLEVIP